jgi:hypothetical protein
LNDARANMSLLIIHCQQAFRASASEIMLLLAILLHMHKVSYELGH